MGLINATLRGFRALKNLNTGGRGVSSVATKEFWVNPMKVNTTTGEIGRKIKDGVPLEQAKKTLEMRDGEKLIGSGRSEKGNIFFTKDKAGAVNAYAHTPEGNHTYRVNPKTATKLQNKAKADNKFNYTPLKYDTDTLTKKTYAIGLGVPAIGYGGYEGYKYLSSDSDSDNKSANVIANAAKINNSQNTETASNTEDGSKNRFIKAVSGQLRTPQQEANLKEIRERRAKEADPERDLPYYAKSGQGQADPIQPPKAKTNVKPKKSANLNYDPIAEWAKTDQATNDKWLKRQADYKKLVDEGVDPYDAYDRTINLYN